MRKGKERGGGRDRKGVGGRGHQGGGGQRGNAKEMGRDPMLGLVSRRGRKRGKIRLSRLQPSSLEEV